MALFSQDEKYISCAIGHLYCYTAAPPVRNGTGTKIIIETAGRINSFYDLKRPEDFHWSNPINPRRITTSCVNSRVCHTSVARITYEKFAGMENDIKRAFWRWKAKLISTPASSLSNGRQTFDVNLQRNIPAPQAFEAFQRTLHSNLGIIPDSLYHYLMAVGDLLELPEIIVPEHRKANAGKDTRQFYEPEAEIEDDEDYEDAFLTSEHKTYRKRQRTERRIPTKDYLRLNCMLSAFLKQLERGQKDARIIACAGIMFRLFVTCIEMLAKEVLELMPESAIKMGTVDKLSKIASMVENPKCPTAMGTGDNKKWNECICASVPCVVLLTLAEMIEDPDYQDIQAFLSFVCYLFEHKEILAGRGLSLKNSYGAYEVVSIMEAYDRLDDCELKRQIEEILPFYDPVKNSILVPPGMGMGLMNAASTLQGLVCSDGDWTKLQSSDDFIAKIEAPGCTEEEALDVIAVKFSYGCISCRWFGTNASGEKTYTIFGVDDYEYNGMWFVKIYIGNYGSELPSLVLAGRNQVDDWNCLLKFLREGVSKGAIFITVLPVGISILERYFKRSYELMPREGRLTTRENFVKKVQDKYKGRVNIFYGGKSFISPSSIHLDSLSLGRALGEVDEDFVRRIMNPRNPFNAKEGTTTLLTFSSGNRQEVDLSEYGPCTLRTQWVENRTAGHTSGGRNRLAISREMGDVIDAVRRIAPDMLHMQTTSGPLDDALEHRIAYKIRKLAATAKTPEEHETIRILTASLADV